QEGFDFWGILSTHHIVGQLYSFVKELSAMGAIVGGFVFVYYRVVRREKRMTLGFEGLLILFIIITMMFADYLYVGGHTLREARASGEGAHWLWYEPFGSTLSLIFSALDLSPTTSFVLEQAGY